MISKKVSHFKILQKIGEGGMGEVYQAEDENLGRQVALKVLPTGFAGDEERRVRFFREARTAASVTHPNIATIHEIFEEDEGIFIAMELLDGETLEQHIGGRPMETDELLRLTIGIAEGLAKAHGSGIVHRDLKPDNVMITSDSHPKILDFGLAKLFEETDAAVAPDATGQPTVSVNVTQEGRILGTVAYMSPEQARGLKLDARSDIFSFGVMLYEMITGKTPFEGNTLTDTLTSILRDQPPPVARANPEAPAELERIIHKCLEKDPKHRYQRVEDLIVDLRNLRRVSGSQSAPRVSDTDFTLPGERSRWLRPAPVLIITAIVLVLAWLGSRLFVPGFGPGAPAPPVSANSLAVMPFQNMQDRGDAERIGQILQELVITDLSGLPELRVLSSQRLFDIQKQLGRGEKSTIDQDVATEVARRAGAATMLTGSVSKLGDKWILTSQLINVADGAVIEPARIDGTDLYGMVDELTESIRGDMGVIQTAAFGGDLPVEHRTSSSLEAYQHYLAGSSVLNEMNFLGAIDELKQAVKIDPSFGEAYYKLAIAEWWERGLEAPPSESDELAPEQVLGRLASGELKASDKYRRLAKASLALVEARYADAAALFQEVVERYPDEKEAWYGLGESMFHGQYAKRTESLEPFERSLELDPSFTLSYRHVFDVYLIDRRYDEIIERVQGLIRQHPDDPQYYGYWMSAAISKGDEEQADQALQAGIAAALSDDERASIYMAAAQGYMELSDFGNARRWTEKYLATAKHPGPFGDLLGFQNLMLGDIERSKAVFESSLESERPNPMAYGGLAMIAALAGDETKAEELADRWVVESKYKTDAVAARMVIHLRQRDTAGADRLFETAIEEVEPQGRQDLLRRSATLAASAGMFERAEKLAREAVEQDSEDWLSHVVLGQALGYQGRFDEAQREFDAVQASKRNEMRVLLHQAELNLLEGDGRSAERMMRQILETGPAHRDVYRGLVAALVQQERYAEAEPLARRAIAMDPSRASRALLAWTLIAGKIDVDEGVRIAETAHEMTRGFDDPYEGVPYIPSPEHALGLAALQRGDYETAARLLREAKQLQPGRALVQQHLQEAIEAQG